MGCMSIIKHSHKDNLRSTNSPDGMILDRFLYNFTGGGYPCHLLPLKGLKIKAEGLKYVKKKLQRSS